MIHTSQRSITAAQVSLVREARRWERENRLGDAADGYLRAEAWREAARVLSALGRYAEAGEALLRCLPEEPSRVIDLAEELKRDLLNAALCFARGGARQECVGLLVNLGEHQRAAALLSAAGRGMDADRVSRRRPLRDNPWPPGVVFPIHKYLRMPEAPRDPFAAAPAEAASEPAPWERPGPSRPAVSPPEAAPSSGGDRASFEASFGAPASADPLEAAVPRYRPAVAEEPLGAGPDTPAEAALPPIDDDFADPWGPPPPRPDAVLPDELGPGFDPAADPFEGGFLTGPAADEADPFALPEPDLPPPTRAADPFDVPEPEQLPTAPSDPDGVLAPIASLHGGAGAYDDLSGQWDAVDGSDDDASGIFDAPGLSYDEEGSGLFDAAGLSYESESGMFSTLDLSVADLPAAADWDDEGGLDRAVDATDLPEPISLSGQFAAARSGSAPVAEEPPEPPSPERATYEIGASSSKQVEVPRLARLLNTPPDSSQYAESAWRVVGFVWREERLSRRVAHFLDEFVRRAALGGAEGDVRRTVYAAGRLFEAHDRPEAAIRAYTILGGRSRAFGDAALRLQNLKDGLAEADDGCWRPVRMMIQGLCGFAALPALETLPREHDPATVVDPERDGAAEGAGELPTGAFEELPAAARIEPVGGGGAPPEALVGPGTLIADRYRVEALLGTGGMASVFRAVDLDLEDKVALKLFTGAGQSEEGLSRFRREMKLSRKLQHPNIVRTFEYGTWMGLHFITMELLQGEDLGRVAARCPGRVLPLRQLLNLAVQACEGLAAAHAVGIVHRDVKPGNLYVTDAGRTLKVMDFGIAKSHTATTVSVTGIRIGTPRYMSPEQIDSSTHVGPSADLYSLGVVLYEAMTGRPVFKENSLARLLLCHLTEAPTPPSQLNPKVPADVEAIVLKLLAKSPPERYANCAALRQALLGALEALPR